MTILNFDQGTGSLLPAQHQAVAEEIARIFGTVELRWIPRDGRDTEEEKNWPFALYDFPVGKPPYLIMVLSEDEVNMGLIGRLYEMRARTMQDILDSNAAARAAEASANAERDAETGDFHAALLKSPLHTYKHDGKVYGS